MYWLRAVESEQSVKSILSKVYQQEEKSKHSESMVYL